MARLTDREWKVMEALWQGGPQTLGEVLARLEEELGTRPAVVATGGDAALIARGVERIDHVDPDITLNGLRIAAVLNL